MSLLHVGPRGRGLWFPASRYIGPLAAASVLALTACDRSERSPADNSVRRVVGNATVGCTELPDTSGEWSSAQLDRNDFPVTALILPDACPRVTVTYLGGAQVERTYRVSVPAKHTLIARARGDSASLALAFNVPTEPKPDRSNVARSVVDSIQVDAATVVAVRVRLVPKPREEATVSRVLLTVVARP